ncbi:enoyl-CoA hydratase/isomerase family protein [Microbulbifer agarilyticus]
MSIVKYECIDHVAVITLNRPEALNAFSPEMYTAFNQATQRFKEDRDAWVAVVTSSSEKSFSAGVDIKALDEFLTYTSIEDAAKVLDIDIEGEYFTNKPIIAAINGYCYGEGLSMALGCDMRIAGESATFCLPESKIGIPTVNASIHSARLMGTANALELLLMGDPRDAAWAERKGLVNTVVADKDVLETAMQWARKIASLAPMANQLTMDMVVKSQYTTFADLLAEAGERKPKVVNSKDAREGRRAFIEKRQPVFVGE